VLSQQIMSGFLYVTSPAAYLIRRLKHSCGTALRGAYHSTLNLIETCPFAMRMSLPSRLNRSIGRKIWFHVRSWQSRTISPDMLPDDRRMTSSIRLSESPAVSLCSPT